MKENKSEFLYELRNVLWKTRAGMGRVGFYRTDCAVWSLRWLRLVLLPLGTVSVFNVPFLFKVRQRTIQLSYDLLHGNGNPPRKSRGLTLAIGTNSQ